MEKLFKVKDIIRLKGKALKLLDVGKSEKGLLLYRIARMMEKYNGWGPIPEGSGKYGGKQRRA